MVGKPNVQVDSKERVAFDLAEMIYNAETNSKDGGRAADDDPRTYWIRLYCQCLQAVTGTSAGRVLGEQD
jgi:hypothetical protein